MTAGSHALYLMHGMKRSGNHAITNWLLPQIKCVHFNNLIPVGKILLGRPMPDPKPFAGWRRQEELSRGTSLPRLLVTLEDHDLRLMPFTGIDIPARSLLILRDARQLFSSRVRKAFRVDMPAYPRAAGEVMERAVTLWKQHARCFLGASDDCPARVAILFDAWFDDIAYRAAISAAMDLSFDDRGYGKVSPEGGGSSFDGTAFNGRAQFMGVANRYDELEPPETELLEAIFQDQELLELHQAVSEADPLRQMVL